MLFFIQTTNFLPCTLFYFSVLFACLYAQLWQFFLWQVH
jgi:hypothetical protein